MREGIAGLVKKRGGHPRAAQRKKKTRITIWERGGYLEGKTVTLQWRSCRSKKENAPLPRFPNRRGGTFGREREKSRIPLAAKRK